MTQNIQAVRGMNDLLPAETPAWRQMEQLLHGIMQQYAYQEVRLPLLEKTELFSRAIGQVTDIVEKEMYTFADRNGDSLTLRPEGTAGVVRAVIEQQMLRGQTPRLYYLGPMFRHERPQKGRYRQFHQVGVEFFGVPGADADAEVIALSARILRQLGLVDVQLELNSLGSAEARLHYRERLIAHLLPQREQLCADCQSRLERNPMRILDCKVPACASIAAAAPRLLDHLDEASALHFESLKQRLDALGIAYQINPKLVRGLDYYNRTVFEWTTTQLGAQGTVLAGGRYDGLVAQIGGADTPAVGFAAGMERLLALREQYAAQPAVQGPLLFLGALGDLAAPVVLHWAEHLRDQGFSVSSSAASGIKPLFKAAERSAARYMTIVGEGELGGGLLLVKSQTGIDQFQCPLDQLASHLRERAS